jgi:hypothetical protein
MRVKKILFSIAAAALVYAGAVALWGWAQFSRTGETHSQERRYDAMAVFFCAFGDKPASIDSETMRRINHAADLFRQGVAGRIICVGGSREGVTPSGAELMKAALLKEGIPQQSVYAERTSFDSGSNCRVVFEIMRDNGMTSLCLVSSPLHTRRLKMIFRRDMDIQADGRAFAYSSCRPAAGPLDLCREVHHEWMAFVADRFLPENLYDAIIGMIRKRPGGNQSKDGVGNHANV